MLIKLFLRNLVNRKRNNIFGIVGLSIGITTSILTGWWVLTEFSFDKFNRDYNKIYRLATQVELNGEVIKIGATFAPVMADIKQALPEIEDAVRCIIFPDVNEIKIDGIVKYVEGISLADTNFFSFFDYKFLLGNPATCFNNPNNIVVSQNFALKYFGSTNIIGKTIEVYDMQWQVSGVIKNVPPNSHIKFEAMLCIQGFPFWDNNKYGQNDSFLTYLKIHNSTNISLLEKQITDITYAKFWGKYNTEIKHLLQPLAQIHFGKGYRFDPAVTANKQVVIMVMLMALAILIIACVNFTNLFISTALLRARSIGIRKTNGASRLSLMLGFFAETTAHTLISLIIGLAFAVALLPVFNNLAGTNIFFDYYAPQFYLFLLAVTVFTVVLSGTFPAFYITRFNPVQTLKGKFKGKNVLALQKSLVVIQYAASIILLLSVLTIKKQIKHFQQMDLGFNISNIIYFNITNNIAHNSTAFANDIKSFPNVIDICYKNGAPHEWRQGQAVSSAQTSSQEHLMEICQVDNNYYNMLDIGIIDGNILNNNNDSVNYALLNQKASKILGFTDAIGQQILIGGTAYNVKGVVADIKNKSLHNLPDPQVYLSLGKPQGWHTILVKTDGNNKQVIDKLQSIWDKYSPDDLFNYSFLDQTYQQMYDNDIRIGKMITIGMIIALILTTLGMFALVKFTMQQRTKEIAVRKVNGATVHGLVMFLNGSFVKWIIVAYIIGCPVAFLIMNRWLQGFAYRIKLSPGLFVLGGLLIISIALLTVSWQTLMAANSNPVKALKDE